MTAVNDNFLEILRCPVERSPLSVMTEQELRELNAAISEGRARYGSGGTVEEPLELALTTPDRTSAYRVQDGVPQLLPRLRIERAEETARPGPQSPETDEFRRLADVWEVLSQRWDRIQPPLRPARQDVDLFQRIAGEALGASDTTAPRALLLGVTPEIATMRRPARTGLLALDSSPAMIRNVWPRSEVADAAVALADWKVMPIGDAAFDLVIGDGILMSQRYPEDFTALAAETRRVLADNGTLAIRLFARPAEREATAAVFADLRAGRIPNFDLFHWRFLMSLHGSPEAGTLLADVWDAWREAVPDPQTLMKTLGWAPDAARVFDTYRGSSTRVCFATVSEVREILSPQFELTACHVPDYEDGARYPTLVLRSRPGSRRRARS